MTRSPDSLIPSVAEQSETEKWDDKALKSRLEGKANLRAATKVNAVSASRTRPTSKPTQLDLFPGRACVLKAKPATDRQTARQRSVRRDGVQGGGTRRKCTTVTGETLFGPAEEVFGPPRTGREAYKGSPRNRRIDAKQGVGGGHSTDEGRENRLEERAATSTTRSKRGKAAGLPPRGSAPSRRKTRRRKAPERLSNARKLQRTLYRVAKSQPERRLTLLYDKICRHDILQEAWQRVKSNKGAAGVDKMDIEEVCEYGEEKFLTELQEALQQTTYKVNHVRRVYFYFVRFRKALIPRHLSARIASSGERASNRETPCAGNH